MTRLLELLLVEDSSEDAALIINMLESAGYTVHYKQVATEAELKTHLYEKAWNVILLDYTMPTFSGLSALKILRESEVDIPVIVVSGTIGEEKAVETLKQGAHDYVLKHNLQRLVPAIERAQTTFKERREYRAMQEELKASEARFRKLFESNIIGVIYTELDGYFKDVNEAFSNMLGYTRQELLEKSITWRSITPPNMIDRSEQAIRDMKNKGMASAFEKQYIHKNGHLVDVLVGLALLDESQTEAIGYTIDISERKARENAEKANLRKNQFLAMMSHELRTPLHTIITGSTMMLDGYLGALNPKQAEYMQLIYESGEHLLKIINDILDYAKIEAGKITLNIQEVSTVELIEDALNLVKPLIEAKDQNLSVEISPKVPPKVKCDPVRLKQVLCNLLSNAYKFTPPEKQIKVRCNVLSSKELLLSVQDEGPGIAESDLEVILKPFEQGTKPQHISANGTGLGLPIAQKIIELHQGSLKIQSQVGKGSEFIVCLPLQQHHGT